MIMVDGKKEVIREYGALYDTKSKIYGDVTIQGKGDWIVYFDALTGAAKVRRVQSNACLLVGVQ